MATNVSIKTDTRQDYTQFILNDKYLNCQRCKKYRNFLEYGCGNGEFTKHLAREYKAVYVVDNSPDLIEQAKENLSAFSNVFYVPDGSKLKIDYVFSYSKLHFLPKELIQKKLEWFHKVMRHKGILKIKLVGMPDGLSEFYTMEDACHLAQETNFRIFKTYGEGREDFWLWMAKL